MRVPPPIIGIIFAILIIASSQALGLRMAAPFLITHIGAGILFFIGLILDLESVLRFFKTKTTVNPLTPAKSQRLVTSGFYKFTRNPMYLGLVFFLGAITLWSSALLGPLFIALFIYVMTRGQIKAEEKALTEIFGQDYIDYCQRAPRWL